MKYIVTGGCGFIGSHLVLELITRGHEVIVVDNLSTGFKEYLPNQNNRLIFLNCDISNWNELSKNFGYFKGARGIFHLAACARIQPSIFNPVLTHDANVTGTLHILEMMRMCEIPNIVYSASSSAYGLLANPPSSENDEVDCQTPYSVSKFMGEKYCETWSKLHKINNYRLRYFNVYGPRSPLEGPYAPVVSLFFRQALRNNPITIVGNGEQRRDFTYVLDVVEANIKAMEILPNQFIGENELFNIGTGKNYSIKDLANMVAMELYNSVMKLRVDIIHVPERIGESKVSLANNSKAKEFLDWEPQFTLERGVKFLCHEYYVRNINALLDNKPL